MGEVIRRNAAVDDILADARETVAAATARGGPVAAAAGVCLGEVLGLMGVVEGQLAESRRAIVPLDAAVASNDAAADATVGQVADETWNALGRPAADPHYALLFPFGIRGYVDAGVDEEPYLLDLLAELIVLPGNPKLTSERKAAWQARIRETAAPLRAAVDARRPVAVRIRLLDRVRTALSRIAQMQLMALKRDYKNAGLSEVQIHEIIPDAGRARKKPASPAKSDTPPATR